MLAFPVAKLERVRTSYQGLRRPPISSAVSGPDLVISTQQHPVRSPRLSASGSRSAELNRQIRELKRSVTYRKHTLAYRLNRQKMQKRSRALSIHFSIHIDTSQAPGFVRSHRGPR